MKTCNATKDNANLVYGFCKYRAMNNTTDNSGNECTYTDFCDYQLPRDSRGQDGIPIVDASEIHSILESQLVCTCNTTNSWCPIHGAKK